MIYYKWNHDKNEKLKAERGIGFEQVVLHIERGDLLDVVEHPANLNIRINESWLSKSKTMLT
jgi:hypothetical protein